jgi:hypothetical protein
MLNVYEIRQQFRQICFHFVERKFRVTQNPVEDSCEHIIGNSISVKSEEFLALVADRYISDKDYDRDACSGNTLDLYSGSSRFEFRPWNLLS